MAPRATRSADITASVPELTKRMLSTQGMRAGDQLGEFQAVGLGGAQAPAAAQGRFGGRAHPRIGMSQDQRPECHAEIEVFAAVDVAQAARPAPPVMKRGVPPTPRKARTGECTPPGRHAPRAREQLLGAPPPGSAHACSHSRAKRAP